MAFLRRPCKNVPGGADENQHESHDVALSWRYQQDQITSFRYCASHEEPAGRGSGRL